MLQLSATELQARTGLTAAEAAAAIAAVSAHMYPPSRGETASALYARATADTATAGAAGALARLSLGDFVLDSFLRGGLVVPGLTELSGESATGKTQLCLQLCLAVQLPPAFGGLGAGSTRKRGRARRRRRDGTGKEEGTGLAKKRGRAGGLIIGT